MKIERRFIKDVICELLDRKKIKDDFSLDELVDKLYDIWVKNNRKVSNEELYDLLGLDSNILCSIVDNELIISGNEVTAKYPTEDERMKAFQILKEYFENAFNNRKRYFERKNIAPVYTDVIPNLIENCSIELKKCDYREGYNIYLKNNLTGKNEYGLMKHLENLILKDEEIEEFFEMLKWYVMNVPYNEWDSINFESSFMNDVISKYYINQMENGKTYEYLEKYLISSEFSRVFESPHFSNTRFSWSSKSYSNSYYIIHDHYNESKYKDHYFLIYNKKGLEVSDSIPRFYVEDIYFFVPEDGEMKTLVYNNGKWFDLLNKEYTNDNGNLYIPLTSMINILEYEDIIRNIPITEYEQILYLLTFIRKINESNFDQVKKLCESTVELFINKVNINGDVDIELLKRELSLNLIINYHLNDGKFYYLFNIEDRSINQPKQFDFYSLIGHIKTACQLNFEDGKVSFKGFMSEEEELCHLENGQVISNSKKK